MAGTEVCLGEVLVPLITVSYACHMCFEKHLDVKHLRKELLRLCLRINEMGRQSWQRLAELLGSNILI